MSDTPETDAFSVKFKSVCGSKKWVPADICRRFERERDDARNIVEKLTEQGLKLMDDNMMLKREIKKLKKKYE